MSDLLYDLLNVVKETPCCNQSSLWKWDSLWFCGLKVTWLNTFFPMDCGVLLRPFPANGTGWIQKKSPLPHLVFYNCISQSARMDLKGTKWMNAEQRFRKGVWSRFPNQTSCFLTFRDSACCTHVWRTFWQSSRLTQAHLMTVWSILCCSWQVYDLKRAQYLCL